MELWLDFDTIYSFTKYNVGEQVTIACKSKSFNQTIMDLASINYLVPTLWTPIDRNRLEIFKILIEKKFH